MHSHALADAEFVEQEIVAQVTGPLLLQAPGCPRRARRRTALQSCNSDASGERLRARRQLEQPPRPPAGRCGNARAEPSFGSRSDPRSAGTRSSSARLAVGSSSPPNVRAGRSRQGSPAPGGARAAGRSIDRSARSWNGRNLVAAPSSRGRRRARRRD